MDEEHPLRRWAIQPILVGCLVYWAVEHPLHDVFPPLVATILVSPVAEVIVAVSVALAWPLAEAAFGKLPGLVFLGACVILGLVIGLLVILGTGLGVFISSSDYLGGGVSGMIVATVICAHFALLQILLTKMAQRMEDEDDEVDDDDFEDDESGPGSFSPSLGKAMGRGAVTLILIVGYLLATVVLTLGSGAVAHFLFGKGIFASLLIGLGCAVFVVGLLAGLSWLLEKFVEPFNLDPYQM